MTIFTHWPKPKTGKRAAAGEFQIKKAQHSLLQPIEDENQQLFVRQWCRGPGI